MLIIKNGPLSQDQLDKMQRQTQTPTINNTSTSNAVTSAVANDIANTYGLGTRQTISNNLSRIDVTMKKIPDSTTYSKKQDCLTHYLRVLRYLFFLEEKRKP